MFLVLLLVALVALASPAHGDTTTPTPTHLHGAAVHTTLHTTTHNPAHSTGAGHTASEHTTVAPHLHGGAHTSPAHHARNTTVHTGHSMHTTLHPDHTSTGHTGHMAHTTLHPDHTSTGHTGHTGHMAHTTTTAPGHVSTAHTGHTGHTAVAGIHHVTTLPVAGHSSHATGHGGHTTTTPAPKHGGGGSTTVHPYHHLTAEQIQLQMHGHITVHHGTCKSVANSFLCCTNGTEGHGIAYNLKSDMHRSIECCGTSTKSLNPNSHFCCNNQVHHRYPSPSVEMVCCKTCHPQEPYNRHKQIECNKTLHHVPHNHKTHPLGCCNGTHTYDTTKKLCCEGQLHEDTMATSCCGKYPLYSEFKCCKDPYNPISNYHKPYIYNNEVKQYCCMGLGVVGGQRVNSGQTKCTHI